MIVKSVLVFIVVVVSFFISSLLGWGSLGAVCIFIVFLGLIAILNLSLNGLSEPICRVWAHNRNPLLSYLIIKKQWIATTPLKVKILTALKTKQLESILSEGTEGVEILLEALNDADHQIANQALKTGEHLKNRDSQVLFYFLSEQWDKYERIDFDQTVLTTIFEFESDWLKTQITDKITDKIKQSQNSEWLSIIRGGKPAKNVESMRESDWQVTLEVLSKSKYYQEMWRLAEKAPPLYSKRLLLQLKNLDFITDKEEQTSIENLQELASQCVEQESELKSLFYQAQMPQYPFHTKWVSCLAISPDGTLLASGSADRKVKLWSLASGQLLSTLRGHTEGVSYLAMSPDGTILASGSWDGTVKLWSLPSGKFLSTLEAHT